MDHRMYKFMAVVEHGGFTSAARELHVSQPALTVAIQHLERELGSPLFERQGKGVILTATGQVVYDSAKRMRTEQRAMELSLRDIGASSVTPLRIGLLDTVANMLFASPTMPMPDQIAVMVDNSDRLLREVRLGRIDAVVVAAPPAVMGSLVARRLHDEQFVFVATPAVAASTNPVAIRDWLAFNPDSHTYTHFAAMFERHGMTVGPSFYSTSMELIRSMALLGRGVALLPRHFVAAHLDSGELVAVQSPPLSRELWHVYPADQPGQGALTELIDRLEGLLAQA